MGKGHSSEDNSILILDQEDRWFNREVNGVIYFNVEKLSFSIGKDLLYFNLFPGDLTTIHILPSKSGLLRTK